MDGRRRNALNAFLLSNDLNRPVLAEYKNCINSDKHSNSFFAEMRHGIYPDVSTTDIFKGCYPFLILTLLLGLVLIAWPDVALWLPRVLR